MEILLLIIGLAAGLAAGFFWAKSKSNTGTEIISLRDSLQNALLETAKVQESFRSEQERRHELEQTLNNEREQLNRMVADNATLKAEWNNAQLRLKEQKQEMEELHGQMSLQFKNLANEIFEEKSKKFTDQN